jgi:flagellar hook-associated protein 2
VSVTSATNTLTGVFNGLTLTLAKVSATPVQISVAQDTAGITKAVQTFVDAYNGLSTLLSTDLKYDSSTKVAGPLQADSAAVSLQRQLRNIVGGASSASSTFTTLSQVGLEVQTDGTLKLNSTKLTNALTSNPSELKKLFTNVDLTTAANNGIANRLRTFGDSVLGTSGLLTSRIAGLNTKLSHNQKDQDNLNNRLDATKARLQAQYSALDSKMASISSLSTYITQQIANWNKNTN